MIILFCEPIPRANPSQRGYPPVRARQPPRGRLPKRKAPWAVDLDIPQRLAPCAHHALFVFLGNFCVEATAILDEWVSADHIVKPPQFSKHLWEKPIDDFASNREDILEHVHCSPQEDEPWW